MCNYLQTVKDVKGAKKVVLKGISGFVQPRCAGGGHKEPVGPEHLYKT